jgi:hypothetical protein
MLLATMFLCMNRIRNDLLESVTDKFVANLVWAQLQAQQASTNIIQSGVLGRFWTSNLIIGNAMCLPMKTIWPTYLALYIFCTMYCDTIMWCRPTKCTLLKSLFQFISRCLLRYSSIMCSSSGRPFVHADGTFFTHLRAILSTSSFPPARLLT